MAKSMFLLFCCVASSCALLAQTSRSDTVLPQKLQLKKTDPNWAFSPVYAPKKSTDRETDSVRSIMYVGPAKKDSMELRLPAVKSNKVDIKIKAGQREPLFRRQ